MTPPLVISEAWAVVKRILCSGDVKRLVQEFPSFASGPPSSTLPMASVGVVLTACPPLAPPATLQAWESGIFRLWGELKLPCFQAIALTPPRPPSPCCPLCFSSAAVSYPAGSGGARLCAGGWPARGLRAALPPGSLDGVARGHKLDPQGMASAPPAPPAGGSLPHLACAPPPAVPYPLLHSNKGNFPGPGAVGRSAPRAEKLRPSRF